MSNHPPPQGSLGPTSDEVGASGRENWLEVTDVLYDQATFRPLIEQIDANCEIPIPSAEHRARLPRYLQRQWGPDAPQGDSGYRLSVARIAVTDLALTLLAVAHRFHPEFKAFLDLIETGDTTRRVWVPDSAEMIKLFRWVQEENPGRLWHLGRYLGKGADKGVGALYLDSSLAKDPLWPIYVHSYLLADLRSGFNLDGSPTLKSRPSSNLAIPTYPPWAAAVHAITQQCLLPSEDGLSATTHGLGPLLALLETNPHGISEYLAGRGHPSD